MISSLDPLSERGRRQELRSALSMEQDPKEEDVEEEEAEEERGGWA